jgi:hypothetical protein
MQRQGNTFGNRHIPQTQLDCQVFEKTMSKGEIGFRTTTTHHENSGSALNWGTIALVINSLSLSRFQGEAGYMYACVYLCCACVNFDGGRMQKLGAVYCAPGCKHCSLA